MASRPKAGVLKTRGMSAKQKMARIKRTKAKTRTQRPYKK